MTMMIVIALISTKTAAVKVAAETAIGTRTAEIGMPQREAKIVSLIKTKMMTRTVSERIKDDMAEEKVVSREMNTRTGHACVAQKEQT